MTYMVKFNDTVFDTFTWFSANLIGPVNREYVDDTACICRIAGAVGLLHIRLTVLDATNALKKLQATF